MEAQFIDSEPRKDDIVLKILMIAGIVLLVVLVIYTFVAIQNKSKETKYIGTSSIQNTINISETGTIYAVPDMALVTFSTITQDSTISEALRKNKEATGRIIDSLKRQEVAETDMKTVDFNVYPQYQWQTKGVDLTVYPLGKRVIVGYEATQSVEVKIRDNDNIGRDIQGAVDAGASQVSGLKFIIDKEDEYTKQAREQAIANAKSKVDEIAKNLNVKVGRVTSFTESSYAPVYNLSEKATTGTGSDFQIAVGENKIQVTVNISYELK